MSPRSTSLASLLSIVPYFSARGGSAPLAEAAADLGMSVHQLRVALWELWMCGLPGYGPGDLIDLSFSAEDLDDADQVEVTFAAGMERPVRLTWAEAVTLETGLAVFLDHPEVVDQTSLRDLMETLRAATGSENGAASHAPLPTADDSTAAVVRDAVSSGLALRFTYHSASSDSSRTRVVDPVRLTVSDAHSYLRAVDRESGGWRTFRTDRMEDAETVGPRRPVGPEPDADPVSAAADGRTARARVPASAAWFLDEFPFHDIVPVLGGGADVTIAYHDREWLVRFLLGHADLVIPSDSGLASEIGEFAARALGELGPGNAR